MARVFVLIIIIIY